MYSLSQVVPVNSNGQVHVKLSSCGLQVPLLRQGTAEQGSKTATKNISGDAHGNKSEVTDVEDVSKIFNLMVWLTSHDLTYRDIFLYE